MHRGERRAGQPCLRIVVLLRERVMPDAAAGGVVPVPPDLLHRDRFGKEHTGQRADQFGRAIPVVSQRAVGVPVASDEGVDRPTPLARSTGMLSQ